MTRHSLCNVCHAGFSDINHLLLHALKKFSEGLGELNNNFIEHC
jgi:hypothetical protein